MELRECITCGSHAFTNNKCDYCGNKYEPNNKNWQEELKIAPLSNYMKGLSDNEIKEIYSNLKEGLTPNQIRTATCKEDLIKPEVIELTFEHGNKRGDKALSFMIYLLVSIVWFAVCVFIPPLFLITICGLIILPVIKKLKK